MATEIIKNPAITGINTGRSLTGRNIWARLLAGKKKLLLGGGFVAAVVFAGFYFSRRIEHSTVHDCANRERGNCATLLPQRAPCKP